jgi:hypothetical protein
VLRRNERIKQLLGCLVHRVTDENAFIVFTCAAKSAEEHNVSRAPLLEATSFRGRIQRLRKDNYKSTLADAQVTAVCDRKKLLTFP